MSAQSSVGRGRSAARAGAAPWVVVVAVVLGLAGAADLVRWANRWYISEQFARDAGTADGPSWEWVYGLLHGAHEALVRGLALLLLAVACAAIAVLARRGARR